MTKTLSLSLSLLAVVLLTAATAAPAAFTVEGTRVRGSTSQDGAPRLEPGQYVDEFTAGGSDLYYSVAREHQGSTLYVGLSGQPRSASTARESVVLRLLTTDLLDCGYGQTYDNDFQVKRRNSVASATVVSWSPGADIRKRCLTDGELILRVSPDSEATRFVGQPFELTVTEEPSASTTGLPPAAREALQWAGMPPVTRPTTVAGGPSFNQARALRTGSYQSEIQPGEARLFKVPVGWGQTLQATARVQKPSAAFQRELDSLEQTMTLRIFGPTRGWATADSTSAPGQYGDAISFTRDTLLAAMTLPVRYNNRAGEEEAQQAASLAGDYYVMVTLSEDKQGQSYRLPYELTVKVAGSPGGAPAYENGQKVTGPGASQLAMADIPSASNRANEDTGARTAGTLAVAGTILLLTGLVTLIVTRTRRYRQLSSEPSDRMA